MQGMWLDIYAPGNFLGYTTNGDDLLQEESVACLMYIAYVWLQVMYYLGVSNVIRSLFNNPLFNAARREGVAAAAGGLRGTPEFTRLNSACGGVLDDKDNGMWELGADGFEPFQLANHSSHLVVIR
jgi:hypothetical protein